MTHLLYWPEVCVFVGPLEQVAAHTHRAPALVIALNGPIRWREPNGPWCETEATVVPMDWAHALDCAGRDVAVVYFDPATQIPRAPGTHWGATARRQLQDLLQGVAQAPPDASRAEYLRQWLLQELAPRAGLRAAGLDPRLDALRQSLQQQPDWTLSQAAAARRVGLSPDRFSRWFSASSGQRWTAYRNWMRLLAACGELGRGDTALTTIALDYGYSSPAHFSAAFRGSFGITPSRLRGAQPIVLAHALDAPSVAATVF